MRRQFSLGFSSRSHVPLCSRSHAPHEPMVRVVEQMTEGKKSVLEVGPGKKPFSKATEFVDWRSFKELEGKPVHGHSLVFRTALGDWAFRQRRSRSQCCSKAAGELYPPTGPFGASLSVTVERKRSHKHSAAASL